MEEAVLHNVGQDAVPGLKAPDSLAVLGFVLLSLGAHSGVRNN